VNPHGDCQCDGPCRCTHATSILTSPPGPAAYSVERGGRTLRVCTRCTQPDDTNVRPLASLHELPLYADYDPLGARILSRTLRSRLTTVN